MLRPRQDLGGSPERPFIARYSGRTGIERIAPATAIVATPVRTKTVGWPLRPSPGWSTERSADADVSLFHGVSAKSEVSLDAHGRDLWHRAAHQS